MNRTHKMKRGIFITGTGTGVGKTIVTAGVLRQLIADGANAMVMKPVQTGVAPDALLTAPASDVAFVLRAANLRISTATADILAHVVPYAFPPACSPHLAARMAGVSIEIPKIMSDAQWLLERYQFLVAESAGGLMVPLNDRETMLDLATALGWPVLLVGHSGLGTINHVLLSLDVLRRRNLPVLGVVLSDTHPVVKSERFIRDDNVQAVEAFGCVRVLARVPYLGAPPNLARLDRSLANCDFSEELQRGLR
jgi:dethiobiotin synthetase